MLPCLRGLAHGPSGLWRSWPKRRRLKGEGAVSASGGCWGCGRGYCDERARGMPQRTVPLDHQLAPHRDARTTLTFGSTATAARKDSALARRRGHCHRAGADHDAHASPCSCAPHVTPLTGDPRPYRFQRIGRERLLHLTEIQACGGTSEGRRRLGAQGRLQECDMLHAARPLPAPPGSTVEGARSL